MLTVVLKLFSLVRPDIAVFGQKDAQQLALVRAMSADFALGIEIEAVPTMRAADGPALSSRNKYLSEADRALAPVLHRALAAGAAAAPAGPAAVIAAAQHVLDKAARSAAPETSARVDYLALVDARSYRPVPTDSDLDFPGDAVLAIAARLGTTRLIDNVIVRFGTDGMLLTIDIGNTNTVLGVLDGKPSSSTGGSRLRSQPAPNQTTPNPLMVQGHSHVLRHHPSGVKGQPMAVSQ